MASVPASESLKVLLFGTRSYELICSCCSYEKPFRYPSIPRFYSSELPTDHGDDGNGAGEIDHEDDYTVKPRSSTKTKRARAMARLINDKPWSTDLESSLSSFSPTLSKTTVLQTLQMVRTPSKAHRFFDWAQESGFYHNDQSFFLMLEILGRARNLNAARNFLFSIEKRSDGSVRLEDKYFNSLIRSYGRAGLFQESIKVFMRMKQIGISPSVVTFNSLLSIVLKRGRTGMAYELYDEMLKTYGVVPDTFTFNILIRGFCRNSMVDEAFRFFKEMSQFQCEPDIITYNTLVDGLCRAGKMKVAHNVMKGMLTKGSNLSPNVVTYTTLMRGYCAKQEIEEAFDVFEKMVHQGLKPNEITFNTLIHGLCEAQKLDKIKEVFNGMLGGRGFVPDTCTINTLVNAHCNTGNLDEALNVFDKMSELRIQPDSATYSVLIRRLCQIGDFGRAEKLFDELAEKEILLHDVGCTPLVAAYNPVLEYLCRNGKTKKAERVFRQLMKRGIQDPPAYKTLIMGHCLEGTFEAGHDLLVWMLRKDFVPDVEIYESLITGLLQKGEPNLAHDALKKMLKSSHLPQTSTFHSVLTELLRKGCARESVSLLQLMLENKIRPTIDLSTDTTRLMFKIGLRDKAFEISRCLYENGYKVKIEELIIFLCQSRKMLEAREMILFGMEENHRVDLNICSSVISGLCKVHRVSEAFGLYYEWLERGFQQPLSCLEELKTALEVEGKAKEAEFVSKRMPVLQYAG